MMTEDEQIPEGCTCDYVDDKTICDRYYRMILTRKDSGCPLHGRGVPASDTNPHRSPA